MLVPAKKKLTGVVEERGLGPLIDVHFPPPKPDPSTDQSLPEPLSFVEADHSALFQFSTLEWPLWEPFGNESTGRISLRHSSAFPLQSHRPLKLSLSESVV